MNTKRRLELQKPLRSRSWRDRSVQVDSANAIGLYFERYYGECTDEELVKSWWSIASMSDLPLLRGSSR